MFLDSQRTCLETRGFFVDIVFQFLHRMWIVHMNSLCQFLLHIRTTRIQVWTLGRPHAICKLSAVCRIPLMVWSLRTLLCGPWHRSACGNSHFLFFCQFPEGWCHNLLSCDYVWLCLSHVRLTSRLCDGAWDCQNISTCYFCQTIRFQNGKLELDFHL